jgi:8-oxo-dGTP diphosphatase
MDFLHSKDNHHGGTYVAPENLPDVELGFSELLKRSINIWLKGRIKVVWIKIPSSRSELLAFLYKAGFVNHHCDLDFVMLTLRLESGATVPYFANHTIGAGGLVINDNNEILTIREKAHVDKYPHNWKFPGGMLDPFEHIQQGVMREVLEETNIKTEFESFIGFRHHHKGQFTTSNIYAVCRLKPLTNEITIQESEIADAKWFPVDEYLSDKKIGKYNQHIVRSSLKHPGLKSINLPDYMSSEDDYEVFMV